MDNIRIPTRREFFKYGIRNVTGAELQDEADQKCSICLEKFTFGPLWRFPGREKPAAMMPCGHKFGLGCLRRYLHGSDERGYFQNRCIYCPRELYLCTKHHVTTVEVISWIVALEWAPTLLQVTFVLCFAGCLIFGNHALRKPLADHALFQERWALTQPMPWYPSRSSFASEISLSRDVTRHRQALEVEVVDYACRWDIHSEDYVDDNPYLVGFRQLQDSKYQINKTSIQFAQALSVTHVKLLLPLKSFELPQ